MQVHLRVADCRLSIVNCPQLHRQLTLGNRKFLLYFRAMQSLKAAIERLASMGEVEQKPEARRTFLEFRDALTQGEIRAAEKQGDRWIVNTWVKQGILLGFRIGELSEMGDAALSFVDKDTFPARKF